MQVGAVHVDSTEGKYAHLYADSGKKKSILRAFCLALDFQLLREPFEILRVIWKETFSCDQQLECF